MDEKLDSIAIGRCDPYNAFSEPVKGEKIDRLEMENGHPNLATG